MTTLWKTKEELLENVETDLWSKVSNQRNRFIAYLHAAMRDEISDKVTDIATTLTTSNNYVDFSEFLEEFFDRVAVELAPIETHFNNYVETPDNEASDTYFNKSALSEARSVTEKIAKLAGVNERIYMAGIDKLLEDAHSKSRLVAAKDAKCMLESVLDLVYNDAPQLLSVINESDETSEAFKELAAAYRQYDCASEEGVGELCFPSGTNPVSVLRDCLEQTELPYYFDEIKKLAEKYSKLFPSELRGYRIIGATPIESEQIEEVSSVPVINLQLIDDIFPEYVEQVPRLVYDDAKMFFTSMAENITTEIVAAHSGTTLPGGIRIPRKASIDFLMGEGLLSGTAKTYKFPEHVQKTLGFD